MVLLTLELRGHDGVQSISKELPWDTKLSEIFTISAGFSGLDEIIRSADENNPRRIFNRYSVVMEEAPARKLIVVTGKPSNFATGEISIDDTPLHFVNLEDGPSELVTADLCLPTSSGGSEELLLDGKLQVKFHRTVRMPDDDRLHQLPPSSGVFPLYNVNAFSQRFPEHIVRTGGVFFSMWQREAMWIQVESETKYAVRVNVGKVNAISGLTLKEKSDKQDYIVVPDQRWIDGIAVEPGVVRQFVAMPLGSGYTIEGQVTGEEKFGGFQIEVTPAYHKLGAYTFWYTEDRDVFGMCVKISEGSTPREHKRKNRDTIYMAPNPRMVRRPAKLSDFLRPGEEPGEIDRFTLQALAVSCPWPNRLNTTHNSCTWSGTIQQSSRVVYSRPSAPLFRTCPAPLEAMGIAAGGQLIQDLVADPNAPYIWNTSRTRLINVHIFSPASFEAVTHIVPHGTPITAKDYAAQGLPFYVVEEDTENRLEGSEILDAVKSVSQMDEQIGVDVSRAPSLDTKTPKRCAVCKTRLCDCIVRPCNHQFCFSCIEQVNAAPGQQQKCPAEGCGVATLRVSGFSAPMNLPGEEAFKVNVPVVVLKVEDGRIKFESAHKSRI